MEVRSKKISETIKAYGFNAPLIIVALLFVFVPVLGTIITSFYKDVSFLPFSFSGLENYTRLFGDVHFLQSVEFTFLFVLVSVSFEFILGMMFALILNEVFPGRGFLRVAILVPWAIPIAISARVWQLIYNFNFGLLNYLAIQLGFTNHPLNWLGSPAGAFISIVISDVWKTTPFIAIILLAGLSTIPGELYEQAMIDGSSFVQRFFKITIPLMREVIVVALLFRTIDAIRIFDLIYILTGGGPGGSTTSISIYAFKYYLSGDFGYGSAISVIVFLAASLLAVLYLKFGKFSEALK